MPKKSHHQAIGRLLEILKRLPTRGAGISARELTDWLSDEGFEVSKRTVERDLSALAVHFQLVYNDKSVPYGWRWMSDAVAEFPALTVADAMSLHLVEDLLAPLLPAALLDSLRRVEGGAVLDLLHVLPRFMRQRLYTYPPTVDATTAARQDCFWTAFNIFNDEPDDRYADMNYAAEVLQTEYRHIASPSQLGDLVFLATEDGTAVHAATYIADDIVFTKNGAMYTQPWILMRQDDMVAIYSIPYPADRPLKVHYYRRASF